jgi:cytochrome c6
MTRTTTGVCSVAAFAVCLLCGCSKETPQKTESSRTAPVQQSASTPQRQTQSGEELFRQLCNNCHPDGGNASDPEKTLHGSALRKNHITTPEDIVRIMRNPISRMIRFDAETIPDKEARTIAEYVLNTFR